MTTGFLIDVDGVLTEDGCPVARAAETLEELDRCGLKWILLTNSTVRSRRMVAERLASRGFPVSPDRILTPALTARRRLAREGQPSVACYIRTEILEDLDGLAPVERGRPADVVLLGDLGEAFDYRLLQEVFERLGEGSKFWALHKSGYWRQGGRIRLDLGAFVAALEFATGRAAEVLGKPSPEAFLEGARVLGLPPAEVAMIGDDVRSDVAAAQAVGMTGLLVRTGKFREDLVSASGARPDAVLDSIADLPAWLSLRIER